VNDHDSRYARLRYTAMGALAALLAVGAIVGATALAAKPRPKTHSHAAVANTTCKTPTAPVPGKSRTPQPADSQPFLNAIQRLVDNGTITATEGQAVDGEIQAGTLDSDTLASSGLTQTQLQAVQQALADTKRALAPAAP
jgi:hypothetical protein